MKLATIKDYDFKNKKVLMRVEFNAPISNGVVTDDTRIVSVLPTINYILEQPGSRLIVMSHLGRPKGKKDERFSLKPVAKRFEELLGRKVTLADDVIGESVKKAVDNLKAGEVLLLENTRFYPQEESN